MTRRHRISSAAVAGALSVVTVGAVLAPAASAASLTCFGKKPTQPVLTAKNKTLKGTKNNDVLIATGKNDTIKGGDGKDLICGTAVKLADGGAGDDKIQITSGKATGGAGNDTLVQKAGKSGKVAFDGGAGTDSLTLSKKASSGSTADGGADADKISVPGSLLNVKVPHTSGDVLNGIVIDAFSPASGGPAFEGSVRGIDLGGAPIAVEGLTPFDPIADEDGTELDISSVAYPAGRLPGTWAVNFGDGDSRTGVGVPPSELEHPYVGTATHTVTVTVTDNLGGTTTQTGAVASDATQSPYVYVAPATVPTASDPKTVQWAISTSASSPTVTYAPVTSWIFTFGDGMQQVGTGTPPATVTHTYPAQTDFQPHFEYQYSRLGVLRTTNAYPQSVSIGTDDEAFLTLDVGHDDRIGTAAQTLQTGNQLSVSVIYTGSADSITLNPGLGGPLYKGSSTSFQYPTAGTFTLTGTVKVAGQPDKTISLPITVKDAPTTVVVTGPAAAEEGPVTYTVSAPVPAGSKGAVYYPGHYDLRSGTSLPTSFTTLVSPDSDEIGASISSDPLPLTDTTGLEWYVYQDADTQISTRAISVEDLRTEVSHIGSYYGGALTGPVTDAVGVSAYVQGTLKTKIASETLDLGNGLVKTGTGDVQSRYPNVFQVALPTPGDHQVVLTAKDSAGHVGRTFGTISVAGELLLTGPTTTETATAGSLFTLTGVAETLGANSKALSWSVDWDDDSAVSEGFGALPASLTHTYGSGTAGETKSVRVYVTDDHGQEKSFRVTVQL